MKMHPAYKQWVLALASVWLYAQQSFAGVQVSENFDTNWPGAPWAYNSFSNVANSVSGWSISSNSIASSQPTYVSTLSNSCFFARGGLATLTSPLLNGIGAVIYDAKVNSSYALINFESSYDGLTWSTNSTISNSVTSLTTYTNIINSYSNQYFRFRRIDTSGAVAFAIDTVRITYPTPRVAISNLTTIPSRPAEQDPVVISANVSIQSVPDTFAMTNYWREWPSTSWTNWIAMTSNSPNLYTATNIPGKAIGTLIEYYARATYTADGTTYSTNSNSTNTYVVIPKSSYTNLSVIGQLNSSLSNGASYLWQGVIQVTNNNPTFQFRGTSNAFTTTWGNVNQSITNIPLYGFAEVTSSNITLNTTNNGSYLFAFNETNLEYSVRSCTYENFNTWTNLNASTNTPSTNSTGWVLVSGNTSNDTSRLFSGTGRSAIIETNGWLQTHYLTNGVGQVSLWYRNWSTTGAPTGKFTVQSGDSNAANWVTLGAVSNIISTNYLFFSVAANNRDSKYVRILNTNAATRLCLDEVVIAQPGAGVSGISTTPTSANILDPITISYTLTSYNGASISNVIAWYRVGTNGQWISGAMNTTDGIHYVQSTPITGLPPGTNALQYTAQCIYNGFLAINMQAFFAGGTNNPDGVTVNTPDDNRLEKFDTNWPGAPWTFTVFSNVANSVSGWSISSNSIASVGGYYSTPSNACFFAKGGESALTSPHLTNGIGAIIYFARQSGPTPTILALESSYDGSSWFTNSIISNTVAAMTSYTNVINSLSNQYFRLRRIDTAGPIFAIDDIRITYPPANVAITNVYINPGYPVAGQAFTASCDVVTLNPFFPAYNIAPVFYGTTYTGSMTRTLVSGTTNHYVLPVSLSAVTRDTPYDYFIRVAFDGYYGSTAENQSPKNSPTGSFTTRAYPSQYGEFGAIRNGSSSTNQLVADYIWQSVFNIAGTNSLTLGLAGTAYSSGSGYATNTILWGNDNNWQTNLPLADAAGIGQTNITLTGTFDGQYVVRFDEKTGEYIVQKCAWQDFDKPGEGDGTLYKQTTLSSSSGGADQDFDDWTINQTRVRANTFEGYPWTNFVNKYINGDGSEFFLAYSGKVVTATGQGYVMQTLSNVTAASDSFIAQASHWGNFPLRGIGQVAYTYAATRTNVPAQLSVYLTAETNLYPESSVGDTNYLDFKIYDSWRYNTPIALMSNITNTSFVSVTNDVNTNTIMDVIFSHTAGTQSLNLAAVSVSEWYAERLQTNANAWIGSEYWIETSRRSEYGNVCRMDVTRAYNATNQYIQSPRLDSGIKHIECYYAGVPSLTQNPPTNITVNFTMELSTNLGPWTILDTISTNFINNTAGTNYFRYFRSIQTPQGGLYVRIKNATATPGALLLDNINIPAYATTNDWYANNVAVHSRDQQTNAVAVRQWYRGVAYLNNTRIGSSLATGTEAPDTNTFPQMRSPSMSDGIGEISFRYRNYATNAPVTPAKLVIQAAQSLTGNESDWTSIIATITNIMNTNDYLYFSTSVYDTTNKYVRIYNDDTYTTSVGRVCLDEVLVTAPLASRLSLSNLVITPAIPLYSNTVDVTVDVYHLFLNPTNISLEAHYGTATTYSALSSAPLTALPMTCIESNLSVPGKWFRYKTTSQIPTNAIDTFVRYSAQATFGGYHPEAHSPVSNKAFNTPPTWLAPLDAINGTNMAYYLVFACPTGAVWINELNVRDIVSKPKYVEVCGLTGVSLAGWALQVFDGNAVTQGIYTITNSFTLSNQTNGYGFWVLGDTNVSTRNMTLTNSLPTSSGGLRLIRNSGVFAHSISYGSSASPTLTNNGFPYVGNDSSSYSRPLALIGTGSSFGDFVWTNAFSYSPGTNNSGQILVGATGEITAPTVIILSFRVNTNVWVECSGTNNWAPTPYYSTNLINTNDWMAIGTFTSTYPTLSPSNTYLLSFERLTNSFLYFFRVVCTNAP
jgi:hypothetical protein